MGKYAPETEEYELDDLEQDQYGLDELEQAYHERMGTGQGYINEEEDGFNAAESGFMRGYMEA